jgi:uroporphyrinogen-III decarboxylase
MPAGREKTDVTRKERIFAAIRRDQVDRVPFATYNLHPFGSRHGEDPSYAELLDLVLAKAGMVCKARMETRTGRSGRDLAAEAETLKEETETHTTVTHVLHTPKGDLRSITVRPAGQPSLCTEHFIKTDEDIERYLSLPVEPQEYAVTVPARLDGELAGRGVAYVAYPDPMRSAEQLLGFNGFAVRCITDIKPVLRLIDFHFDLAKAELRNRLGAAAGCDFLFHTGGPEVCTPPMMSPELFAQLVTPYETELIEMIHDAGHVTSIHCHGRVGAVMDELLKMGPDVLEPIEPPEQGDMTLGELFARAEGRLCLMGHIQDQELHYVPPGTMTKRVEEIARVAKDGTGYIMTPTCTPFQHPADPAYVRNYMEWIEAADRLLR